MGTTLPTKKMHKNESKKSQYMYALAQPIQEKLQSNNAPIIKVCHSPRSQSEDFCPELSQPTTQLELSYSASLPANYFKKFHTF